MNDSLGQLIFFLLTPLSHIGASLFFCETPFWKVDNGSDLAVICCTDDDPSAGYTDVEFLSDPRGAPDPVLRNDHRKRTGKGLSVFQLRQYLHLFRDDLQCCKCQDRK